MYNVRAVALLAALGTTLFAAGCGGNSGAAPPLRDRNPALSSGASAITLSTYTSQYTPPPSSSYTYHVQGQIVALKSATEFQIQGGTGVGYLNVYTTSSTALNMGGAKLAVGQTVDVYGTGSSRTYVTASTVNLDSTSSSTPAPSGSATAPPSGSYTLHVHGPIVAIKSSTEFQINGGTGVGYLNVYTTSSTTENLSGLKIAVGTYADVYGSGSTSTYATASWLQLSTTSTTATPAPSGSATPPPSGTYTVHVHGPIVAIKSSTEFQINGGSGVGYLNVYTTSSTTQYLNGLKVAVGTYADVYGSGSTSTYATASWLQLSSGTTSGATPTPAPVTNVPKHVLTAALIYGYAGTPTSVSVSSMAPYVSWAQTDPSYAAELRSAGIKVDVYMNFWRNYSSDNPAVGYTDLKPGGAHAAAEVKNCSGVVSYDSSYGGGYEANAMSSSAAGHAAVVANYRESEFGSNYDALFSDDTGALYGIATPCGYTDSAYKSATNSVDASLGKPTFVNTLNAGTSVVSQAGYASASNVIGAMCESCYAYWNTTSSGGKADYARYGSTWVDTENGEALLVSEHKIFWDYARAIGSASSETALRTYVYASFLLTYDPNYAMLQEVFSTPSGFEVFPETGLVPMQPLTTSTNVSSYLRSGGAYMREFGSCYYRGSLVGKCAVVVNPSNTSSATVPTTAYSHAMVLSGYSVIDGGTAGFGGSRPSSLAPMSAAILFP